MHEKKCILHSTTHIIINTFAYIALCKNKKIKNKNDTVSYHNKPRKFKEENKKHQKYVRMGFLLNCLPEIIMPHLNIKFNYLHFNNML